MKVTHGIDERKGKKIERRGLSVLAIDLSSLMRAASIDEIWAAVVDGVEQKRWVFNARAAKIRRQAEELGTFIPVIERGLAKHVDGCPLHRRSYKGKPFANVLHDCLDCEFRVKGAFDGVTCLGFEDIVSYEDFLKRIRKESPALS